jgi:hypothetical protein
MKDTMSRGRSQVIWRYLPGATFRYNESGAWCEVADVTIRDPKPVSVALTAALGHELRRWKAITPTGYPDPALQPGRYEVGEPYHVYYSVWPTVFTCRRCGRAHWYSDLDRMRAVNDRLACRSCREADLLRQVPYAYVCECGRKDTVFIAKHSTDHKVILEDKGSFEESFWYCTECHLRLQRNSREGLGYRSCECAPRKAKRGVILQDTRVYYPQTLQMVEVEPSVLERWRDNPHFSEFLLGGCVQARAYSPHHILDLSAVKGTNAEPSVSMELQVMRDKLIGLGMDAVKVEEMIRDSVTTATGDPWGTYANELDEYVPGLRDLKLDESRQTIEYVFTRDEPSMGTISLKQIQKEATAFGDNATAQRLADEQRLAYDLGLLDLAVVESLPLLLAGYGFTRFFASPQAAEEGGDGTAKASTLTLRSFKSHGNKIPIYAARNTTEALGYRLDPYRLAAFLEANHLATTPGHYLESEPALRSWLLGLSGPLLAQKESHLVHTSWEEDEGLSVDQTSAFLFGVLHTMSHVLKATAYRYVGVDADSLAEYLFPAHAAGLLYVSSHVAFTLGGIDSVVRSNLTQWLGAARDYAGQCSFDPVCSHAGGACMACLYPKFGCGYFNRTVSRAFLFGGRVMGHPAPVVGLWQPEVSQRAAELTERKLHGAAH